MKINSSTSILFWLFMAKKSADGKAPIYCRITMDGERAEFSTGKKIHPDDWDSGVAKGRSDDAISVNKELSKIKANLQKKYDQLEALEGRVTPDMLRQAHLGISPLNKTFGEAFKEFNQLLYKRVTAKEPTLKERTWKRFDITKDKALKFIKAEFKVSDKFLKDLPASFGDDFLLYLTTTDNLSRNTAMKYVKNTKQLMDWAKRKGYLEKDPLDGFKCTYKQPKRARLTWNELVTLYNTKMPVERLEEVKDVYVFTCFTGYSYMDIYELTPENVMPWIDGQKWLIRDRFKGDHNKSNVPLLEIALEIIDKYKRHAYCIAHNKLLPVNSNQRYNGYLKEIADIAGINKTLTTHTARHTFATTILLENDCPIESASEMLGHNSIRTTQIYAKATDIKVSNNMREVKQKISERLSLLKTGS